MRSFITTTVAVVSVACSAVAVAAHSEEAVQASSGCEAPLAEPGDYADTYVPGDPNAKYWAVVPETYAQDAPVPLVLWLSSGDGDADTHYGGWRPYLDDIEELFVVGRPAISGPTVWGWDTDALLALIDQLEGDYCVDPRRVHVMGESSSALATSQLACEASERIASFLDGMGGFALGCTPERPVPLLAITGELDSHSVILSVERWAKSNGCEADSLIEDLGSGVSRHTYQGCDADITLFDIDGAGHSFIFHECVGPAEEAGYCREYAEVDQLDEALAFFESHPLPAE